MKYMTQRVICLNTVTNHIDFYRAMHYSAERGLCDCMPSVRLSVRPSVTLVDWSHRLEILETNSTDN